MQMANRNA